MEFLLLEFCAAVQHQLDLSTALQSKPTCGRGSLASAIKSILSLHARSALPFECNTDVDLN